MWLLIAYLAGLLTVPIGRAIYLWFFYRQELTVDLRRVDTRQDPT